MTKRKAALIQSLLAVIVCAAMIIGSTWAWFADSVTNNANIVQSGNLDIGLEWTADLENGPWIDTEDTTKPAIFTHDKWEPGYAEVRYFKIENRGDLAFKYAMQIVPNSTVTQLANVIDVYYIENPTAPVAGREDLVNMTPAGTLADVISGKASAQGVLLPEGESMTGFYSGEIVLAVALKMQEAAGNEYQNMSIGGNFSVLLHAAQYSFEEDSFGSDYDAGAELPGFTFPEHNVGGTATGQITAENIEDGKLKSAVSLSDTDSGISAVVPAGVAVAEGATELKLVVSTKEGTDSGITLGENEELRALDVHIDGVAADNTVPMTITIEEAAPVGLNMGNYKLYHVEGGATIEMTLVDLTDDFTTHNQFKYDPATGDIMLYMATFSEVAMTINSENAWEGKFDYSWYTNAVAPADGASTADADYVIANADQLAAFGAIVGGMNGQTQDPFSGQTVKLVADVNLGDAESENNPDIIFYPIGYYNSEGTYEKTNTAITSGLRNFEGTFDGAGHTISNFYHNTWEMKGDHNWYSPEEQYYRDGMGLFGRVYGGTVKNLTVDHFSSDGEIATTGVIAAYADGATFENIAITNCNPRVYNIGNGGIVGCVGWYAEEAGLQTTFKNITVDNSNKISALWGSYDVACGGIVGQYYPTSGQTSTGTLKNAGIHLENCHVAAQLDVYNDVCGNYQYYAYRYAGMIIGSIRENTTNEDGKTIPDMTGITATGCTVNYGDWNDYYYCEFEKNGHPSYSGPDDYKFSRVPHSELNFTDSNGNGLVDADERDSVTGCKHDHTDAENNKAIYLPFHQLFTGYGWGVNSIGLEKYSGIVTNLDITEGDQEGSVVKFDALFDNDPEKEGVQTAFLYRVGNQNTVSLGSLFKAVDDLPTDPNVQDDDDGINDPGVWATIDKVDENSNVSGTFTPNTSDWTKGTIQFSGTGVVKVTIQDYNFCTPTVLTLEVVDAVNATGATNATANNVVLLNDITSGFTVSGDYTFYGNGFTLNYTGNGQYLNNGLRQGLVTVSENGTLDNLRIKASIYPRAYMYYGATVLGDYVQGGPSSVEGDKTRYHYQLSAVVAKGDATVSNCYIYGGRTNIFIDTGDVTVENTVLECGTVANVQIQSTNEYTVTFEDVTTIQYQVNPTLGETSNVMLGTGVLVGPDTSSNPTIVLNGDFKQYNWVTEDDANAVSDTKVTKAIIQGALDATAYNHTVNGKTASNLGIIYMNTESVSVTNSTGLPYVLGTVSISGEEGQVYSLQNATTDRIYSDHENADKSTEQGDYMPVFEFDLGNQEISYDGSEDTRYLYGDKNGVTALYQDGDDPITLDLTELATVTKHGKKLNLDSVTYKKEDGTILGSDAIVELTSSGTLVFTVTDNIFYDANGELVEKTVNRIYTVPLSLTVKEASIKNAKVSITKTALDGVYTTVNVTDYKLRINFLDCISVTDYDNKGTETTVNLSSNISSATLTPSGVNVFSTASTATITYTDGRVLTVNFSKISGSSPGTKTATLNTSGGLYFITDGALNNKPTEASSQNKCTITSVSYKGNSGSTVTNDTDVTVTWELGSSSSGGSCVTPDTLITLADGSQVRVDSLKGDEELLVWNMETGSLDSAPIMFVDSDPEADFEIIHLYFSDGTDVKVISEHGFWDYDLNRYVYLDRNAADYIGHTFAKLNGDLEKVTLTDVVLETETTTAWSPVTEGHLCYFVNGMLSMPGGVGGLFNIFDADADTMTYDYEAMARDIETYGLFTYEELNAIAPLSEDMFNAAGGAYLKVSIGKGNLTMDELIRMIERYSKYFS